METKKIINFWETEKKRKSFFLLFPSDKNLIIYTMDERLNNSKKEIKITCQYFSDLHLEFYKDPLLVIYHLKPVADYLFIAGDLGYPFESYFEQAFRIWSPLFKHIFYVHGNHELYNPKNNSKVPLTSEEIQTKIKEICSALPNVSYLNNEIVDICLEEEEKEKISFRVIGSSLFYSTPSSKIDLALQLINDYKYIYIQEEEKEEKKSRLIHPKDVNKWNKKNKEFLQKMITDTISKNIPCIVMSHHCLSPCMLSHKYLFHKSYLEINFAYANEGLEKYVQFPFVRASICGHSHGRKESTINLVPAYRNAIGYPEERSKDLALSLTKCFTIIL